jgi:cytosine/adenosine deaminase-related metal-dependent hydrolase
MAHACPECAQLKMANPAVRSDWRATVDWKTAASPSSEDAATLARLQSAEGRSNARILIKGGTIISMDPSIGDLAKGDVLITGGKIAAIAADLGDAAANADVVVDAAGMIVIPGFHDTHRHCWQGQMRRLIPDVSTLGEYMATTHGLLALHYRPEDIYLGNLISGLGAIDAGITTLMDFSHNPRSLEHAEAAIAAHADTGIRAVWACCAAFQGPLTLDWPNELINLKKRFFSTDDQLLTMRLGLMGVPVSEVDTSLTPAHLAFARDLGVSISTDGVIGDPAAEAVEACGKAGVLGPDLTLIHCTALTELAWKYIADSGTTVSLAATSDAQLGIGASIPPIQLALDHGVQPALSIDVEISLSYDMFTQMRVVLNTQHMLSLNKRFLGEKHYPDAISTRDVLRYATIEGARANGLESKSGSLTPGKDADIVLVDASSLNAMPLNNAVGTVVSGSDSRNIDTVFIGGNVRKWRGRVLGFDPGKLNEALTKSRDYLFEKSKYPFDIFSRGVDFHQSADEAMRGY